MKKIKNPHRSRLTDDHLHHMLRECTSNFDVEIKNNSEQYPTAKITILSVFKIIQTVVISLFFNL